MKTGIELIAAERERQTSQLGWTPEHDDAHGSFDLSDAAICYADAAKYAEHETTPVDWPWETCWWKPSDDPVRNLVKAGALIAAEIDRLQRSK